MAKIIISGDFKESDIMLIAKFFREFWRHRKEKIYMLLEGYEEKRKEEVMEIFRKIFTENDKDWSEKPLTKNTINEWKKSLGVKDE